MNYRITLLFLAVLQSAFIFAQNDTIPPSLVNFQSSETCIDVTSSSVSIDLTVEATDNLLGVNSVLAFVRSPNNSINSAALNLVSGTPQNGIFGATMTFDTTTVEGTHEFELHLTDVAGNFVIIDQSDLSNMGFQDTLKVINANSDSIAPQLTNFQVSESCIDVSNSSVQVVFTVDATDNLFGVASALVFARAPNNSINSAALNLISGTVQNGSFEGTMTFDNIATVEGIHEFELHLTDAAGNFALYHPSDLSNMGFQDTLKVININSDAEAPMLINFQVSESCITLDTSAVDVVFTVEATDNLSGLSSAIVFLFPPNFGITNFSTESAILNLISGTSQNGIYEGTIQLSTSIVSGIHEIELHMQDTASNLVVIDSLQLNNLGFQSELKVVNNILDLGPPELVDLQVSESCIDVSNNTVDVFFTAHALDDSSGVMTVSAILESPNNTVLNTNLMLTSGSSQDGMYEGVISLSNISIAGTHTLSISMVDSSYNYNSYNSVALANLGLQDTLKLLNSNSDTIPPQLINFQISEDCEDVFLSVDAIDNFSGISQINATFSNTSDSTTTSFNFVSGTIQNGIFESIIAKDSFTITDTYCIAINIQDLVGNSMTYDDVDLSNLGLPNKFNLNNEVICYHTKKNTVELTDNSKGLVYVEGNSCNRVTVENDGSLAVNSINCTSTGKDVRLECGDLYIESLTPRLIMKSPNNSCWLLDIASNGQVATQSTSCNSANANTVVDGDIIFDYPNAAKGVLLKTSTNSCSRLVIQNNQLIAIGACCPD